MEKPFKQILPLRSEQDDPERYRSAGQASFRTDTNGRLWFYDGRITRWWNDYRLQTFRNRQEVFQIEDAWGKLWFTNENGEVHQYDATLKLIPYSPDVELSIDRVRSIFEAINGDLWFGHDNGVTVI